MVAQHEIQHQRRSTYASRLGATDFFIVRILAQEIEKRLHRASVGRTRCLDVGCGRQPFRHALESLGYAYTSLDVAQNPEGTVDHIGPVDQPLPPALTAAVPFDFIICTEVLEHVFDWHMAMKNLTALLAPGGELLVTCPFVYPLHEEPYDQWRPTVYTIRKFAEQHGLVIHELAAVGTGYDVLGTVISDVGSSPKQRGFSGPVLRLLFRAWKAVTLYLCDSNILRQRLELGTKFYLSNIAVLRKPPAP